MDYLAKRRQARQQGVSANQVTGGERSKCQFTRWRSAIASRR